MSQGAQIIELDTDGIYFSPPKGITIEDLQSGLSAQLPAGIEVEFDSQKYSTWPGTGDSLHVPRWPTT